MKYPQLITLLLLLTIGAVSKVECQINIADWKQATLKASTNFPAQAIEISITDFKKKLKSQCQDISIPSPSGDYEVFEICPTMVVAKEVAHLYTIRTFRGVKKGDPSTIISCDLSDGGFHAAVYNSDSTYFIEPSDNKHPEQLLSYFNKDKVTSRLKCHADGHNHDRETGQPALKAAVNKRIFRLAVTASGEYSQQFGGSPYNVTNVLNAFKRVV